MKTWIKYGAVAVLLFLFGAVSAVAWGVARTPAGPHGSCTQFPNVAAWLSFDEASGNLTVPAGCGAAATVFTANGTPTYGLTAGVPQGLGSAITFANSDYFTTAAHVAALDPGASSDFILELDFIQTNSTSAQILIDDSLGEAANGFLFYIGGGSNSIRAATKSGGTTNDLSFCNEYQASYVNTWHHLRAVASRSAHTITGTLDGVACAVGAVSFSALSLDITSANPLVIGGESGQNSFKGSFADLQLTIGNTTNNDLVGTRRTQPAFLLNPQLATFAEQVPGNCADPNVAAYLSMDNASGNLTVPTGCAASGTVFTKTGSPTYSQQAPPGLSTAIKSTTGGATDYFQTAGDVTALALTATTPFVIELWYLPQANGNGLTNIVSKAPTSGSVGLWALYQNTNTGWAFQLRDSSGTQNTSALNAATLTAGVWAYLRCAGTPTAFTCTTNGANSNASATSGAPGTITNTNVVSIFNNQWTALTGGSAPAGTAIADLRITIGNSTNNLGYNNGLVATTNPVANKPGNCTDSNVAAWLSLDDASGNLTVPTGCGAAGTVFTAGGTPVYSQTAPPGLGTAITFDGTTNYFTTASSPTGFDVGVGTRMVIELWMKETNGAIIVVKRTPAGTDRWGITVSGTKPRMKIGDGTNTCTAASTVVVTDNVWHHVRGTWDGVSICTVQTDGEPVVSTTQAVGSTITTQPVSIGADNDGTTKMTGSIADLRITIGNSTNDLGYSTPLFTTLTPTFTRATVSTRYNPSTGLLEAVASGAPVVGAPIAANATLPNPRTPVGALVQATTTYLRGASGENNETLATTWTANACATRTNNSTDTTAPDGTQHATKVAQAACSSLINVVESTAITVTASQTPTMTVWLCGASGGEQIRLGISDLGGLDAQAAVTLSACGANGSGFKRYVFTTTNDAGTTNFIGLYTAAGHGSDTFYAWRPCFYNKPYPVPIDPAISGATTINTDVLTYEAPISTNSGITVVGWDYSYDLASTTTYHPFAELCIDVGCTVTPRIRLEVNDATGQMRFSNGTTVAQFGAASPSANVWHHYAWTVATGSESVFVDSAKQGSTQTVAYTTGAMTQIRIGNRSIGFNTVAFFSGVGIYNGTLSASQILALYNSQSTLYAAKPHDPIRDWMLAQLPAPLARVLFGDEIVPTDGEIVRRARARVRLDPVFASAIEVHP